MRRGNVANTLISRGRGVPSRAAQTGRKRQKACHLQFPAVPLRVRGSVSSQTAPDGSRDLYKVERMMALSELSRTPDLVIPIEGHAFKSLKTIFIIVDSGMAIRNILRTDVFRVLRTCGNLRIVIF